MKVMRLKIMLIVGRLGFLAFLGLLAFVAIFISNEEDSSDNRDFIYEKGDISVSEDVLKHQPTVEKYAQKYGISVYVSTPLAIIEVESGGKLPDVMQSSESLGLPPNSLDTEASIQQGTKYFSDLLRSAEGVVSMRIQPFKHITMVVLLLITSQKETHNIALD